MMESALQFLQAFDELSAAERREVAIAVLRRVLSDAPADLTDEDLVSLAEDRFLDLEKAENQHAET